MDSFIQQQRGLEGHGGHGGQEKSLREWTYAPGHTRATQKTKRREMREVERLGGPSYRSTWIFELLCTLDSIILISLKLTLAPVMMYGITCSGRQMRATYQITMACKKPTLGTQ